jgi:acyl-coenzyme A synthetase/AMP-(fatty) acid ligase
MPAPPEFIALMLRFNELGRLLPQGGEAQAEAVADRAKRAELKLVIAEMRKVRAEIDAFLNKHGKPAVNGAAEHKLTQ